MSARLDEFSNGQERKSIKYYLKRGVQSGHLFLFVLPSIITTLRVWIMEGFFMYYNNNYNNNYNGRYNQYGGGQTNPYQQQQPTYYQQPINVNDLPIDEIRYMTTAEADAYIVMPNHKALLIDKASGVAKIKAADMSGQSTSKLFSFKEINESDMNAQQKPENLYLTREESANYVKKSDFDAFTSKDFVTRADFNEVLKKLDALQNKPTKKVGEN